MISIIAAIGKNNIIGHQNSLPWKLPEDMKRFKEITMGKPVIMGRRTFESIGRPLPGRKNIVLSGTGFSHSGCVGVSSVEEALEAVEGANEIMVIGGGAVYKQFMPLADRMYLTIVDGDFHGDVFFPEFDRSQWHETEREHHASFTFVTLDRK